MHSKSVRLIAISLVLVLLVLGAVSFFTPFLGRARLGPMAGFAAPGGALGIGPMSFGMMREVHAMADVETEFDYMVRMLPHHREAVESARVLGDRTNRAEMRTFAAEIIDTQTREIEQMETWITAWYPERDRDFEYQPIMRDYSGLSGNQLDLAFLQDMIPHHMAAVIMSEQLLSQFNVEHGEIEELAASIRTTQTQEIRQMGLWMDTWFD
ncbi:MAG: DUF305 domain-containing protein [Spirochaeta sp.]|jgi:uncharacterized protein (DUF305 family)|nr:DUF305 domain-containing protein [Spirochaeta sp.]